MRNWFRGGTGERAFRSLRQSGLLREFGTPFLERGVYSLHGCDLVVEHPYEEVTLAPPATPVAPGDRLARRMAGMRYTRPSAWHLEAADVHAIAPFHCPIVAGNLLVDSVRRPIFLDFHFEKKGLGTYRLKEEVTRGDTIPDPVILVDTAERRNYFHFLVEVLPRAIHYGAKFPDHLIVVSRNMPDGFRRILADFVGAERLLTAEVGRLYHYRTAVCVHSVAANIHSFSKVLDLAADRILERYVPDPGPPRDLYVSRADAGFRRLAAPERVEPAIAAAGYETVVNSELGFAGQVRAFAAARRVIGVHGAGLANLVFARRLRRLTEFLPQDHQHPSPFWALASLRGAAYHRHLSPEAHAASHATATKRDVSVDPSWIS